MTIVTSEHEKLVRIAARAIGRANLAHAYGHCSLRLNKDFFLVCSAQPMGLITPEDSGTLVPVNGPLPAGVLGEVRIHQQIYQRRDDVHSVCRTMPKSIMTLSALGKTPRPLHGFSSYFWPQAPLWDDPQLIRDDVRAMAIADMVTNHKAIVMRGNGLITLGKTIQHAVVWAWYMENSAEIELSILARADQATVLSQAECEQRATENGGIIERMWDYLTAGDPEL